MKGGYAYVEDAFRTAIDNYLNLEIYMIYMIIPLSSDLDWILCFNLSK